MTLKEVSDFEIVFGGDKPKYGNDSRDEGDGEEWHDGIDAEDLLGAAVSEHISLFGLCFRGKPIAHPGPYDTSIVRQFKTPRGWLVITNGFSSENMQNAQHPHWTPYFIWKHFPKMRAIGEASLNAIYFDENLQHRQTTNFFAYWKAKGAVRDDRRPTPVELETNVEIIGPHSFQLVVQGVDRFTFRFWEDEPKRFRLPRYHRVEYMWPLWRRAWFTIHPDRVGYNSTDPIA
ncbi:MAG: hypothetical protein ACPG06_07530 [Alphaproteobacteria bacterium]